MNKKTRQLALKFLGPELTNLIKILKEQEYTSEYIIAEKLNKDINQTRGLLYQLSQVNLVTTEKQKDKLKGWYIYYWKFLDDNLLYYLYKSLKKEKERYEERINEEKENTFFICPNKCVRLTFDEALNYNFRCPECGEVLKEDNDKELINKLEKRKEEVEKEIEEVEKEIEKKEMRKEKKNAPKEEKEKIENVNKTNKNKAKKTVEKKGSRKKGISRKKKGSNKRENKKKSKKGNRGKSIKKERKKKNRREKAKRTTKTRKNKSKTTENKRKKTEKKKRTNKKKTKTVKRTAKKKINKKRKSDKKRKIKEKSRNKKGLIHRIIRRIKEL